MADPLSPYWSTVGVRQVRSEGNAVSAASILDFRGSGFAVEHIAATPSQPIPSIRVTASGPTSSEFTALQASVAAIQTTLSDATPGPTPDTLAERDSSGNCQFVDVIAQALQASAVNISTSMRDHTGTKGVEVVSDGAVQRLGFFGNTPNPRPVMNAGPYTVDDVINALGQLGLFEI